MKFITFLLILLTIPYIMFSYNKIELKENSVSLNQDTIIVFRNDYFNQTPTDRASLLAFELIKLSDANLLNNKITYTLSDDKTYSVIYINYAPITYVTIKDAESQNTTLEALTKKWINNIKNALTKVSIYMKEKESVIPLNESQVKYLYGYDLNDVSFIVEDTNICDITYNSSTKTFDVFGKNLGSTNIKISNGLETIDYKVTVQKYAATFPKSISSYVTGNPCPSDLVYETLLKSIERDLVVEPNAKYKVNSIKWTKKNLYPTSKTGALVNITAYGDNYITKTKDVTFYVENIYSNNNTPDYLLYSNNPETVDKNQDLFTATLETDKCNRLLYHHMNKTGKTSFLLIEVINPNDTPVSLRLRKGNAKPQRDTIAIGIVAIKNFMNSDDNNISTFENIPPKSKTCIILDKLVNLNSSSGILQLWQTKGDNSILRIKMVSKTDLDTELNKITPYKGTGQFTSSDFIFDSPKEEFNETYTVGNQWVFINIGKNHLKNSKHLKLYGNYGVSYNCNITIENPTNTVAKVRAYVDPTAGPLAGYFKVNNEYKLIHHIKPPKEGNLGIYYLNPGETKHITIKTIPVSGSNYPAKIVVCNK